MKIFRIFFQQYEKQGNGGTLKLTKGKFINFKLYKLHFFKLGKKAHL